MTDELAERKALRKLDRVMRQVRTSIDPNVPIQIVQAFLTVALKEGTSLRDITSALDANTSTASRHLADLGERNRRMEPGYQLVESRTDPMSRRTKNYSLTPKGRLLAKTLVDIMED